MKTMSNCFPFHGSLLTTYLDVNPRVDYSINCDMSENVQKASITRLEIPFMSDWPWIRGISRVITSINWTSTECWSSPIITLFELLIAFIDFLWIECMSDSNQTEAFYIHHLKQLNFHGILKSLDYHASHSVHPFHQLPLNEIRDWIELNHMHFSFHHFKQLKFHGMVQFLDQIVLMIVPHFHQFQLNQIRNWNVLEPGCSQGFILL
jgi:hypothetical protein